MTLKSWKTNFLGLNIPNKVILASIDEFDGIPAVQTYSFWPFPNTVDNPSDPTGLNYPTDPWYGYAEIGGTSSAVPYQWVISFSIPTPVLHGSNLTRTPYQYTMMDIEVGDYVAGAGDGKTLQVVSVLSKTETSLTAIVEDTLRYNTFASADGNGLFSVPGSVVFFNINELGYPLLDPLPPNLFPNFAINVQSRFNWLNPLNNYVLQQNNNNFQKGDAVCIENEQFVLSSANNVTKFVGTVLQSGPGPNQFILRPANGIIDFVPGLPGVVGDYIYPSIDGSGDLTTDDASRRPIFMKIAMEIPSFTIGQVPDPVGSPGDIYQINGYNVETNPSSAYTVTQAAEYINAKTNLHKVTADIVGYRVIVESDTILNPGAYVIPLSFRNQSMTNPLTATINGVTVEFTSYIYGLRLGDPSAQLANDWAADINAAQIPNIVASVNNNNLVLTNIIGGSINIVNIHPDINGNPFAGPNSCSSVSLSTPANITQKVLRLTRNDGGPINLRDYVGIYLITTSRILSGQNGQYALGLNIEQGLRASLTTVVANLLARDALYPLVGDQAYVINSDDGQGNYIGQWSQWLWNGSVWTLTGRQESADSTAKTLSLSLDSTTIASNSTIGTISTGTRVSQIIVEVTTAFDGNPTLDIGYTVSDGANTESSTAGLMSNQLIDLSTVGTYTTTSDTLFGTDTITGDVVITTEQNFTGSNTGTVQILVSYV